MYCRTFSDFSSLDTGAAAARAACGLRARLSNAAITGECATSFLAALSFCHASKTLRHDASTDAGSARYCS
jgi:hypothetical protein